MCAPIYLKVSVKTTESFKYMGNLINSREAMPGFTQRWQCVNSCPPFETFSTAQYCPHCASTELYPLRESDEVYESRDEAFYNYDEYQDTG
jgi:hypothetical protein